MAMAMAMAMAEHARSAHVGGHSVKDIGLVESVDICAKVGGNSDFPDRVTLELLLCSLEGLVLESFDLALLDLLLVRSAFVVVVVVVVGTGGGF
jgi:hypothetical protein